MGRDQDATQVVDMHNTYIPSPLWEKKTLYIHCEVWTIVVTMQYIWYNLFPLKSNAT